MKNLRRVLGLGVLLPALLLFPFRLAAQQSDDGSKNKLDELSLEEMMSEDYSKLVQLAQEGRGDVGGFGERLRKISDGMKVNGFLTNEFTKRMGEDPSFDNHYLVLFFNARINDKTNVEAEVEYEHGGETIQLLYAQIDYKIDQAFIIRTGKFLIPSSPYNQFYYPEFLTKTVNRSYINEQVSPTVWSGVGVQVRGRFDLGDITPYYAIYSVNGLSGTPDQTIREMRPNNDIGQQNIAIENGGFSYGGRIGMESKWGVELGSWIYGGSYNKAESLQLLLGGIDLSYRANDWFLIGEYQLGRKERPTGISDQQISGYSLLAAYLFESVGLEPVLRYDTLDYDDLTIGGDSEFTRITTGLNYHISDNFVLKANYEFIQNPHGPDIRDNAFSLQLAIGF
jgi:hypothetical protein